VRCARDPRAIASALSRLHPKKREDFTKTYAVLRSFELRTQPSELARTAELIGRAPTPYRSYVQQMAAAWRAGLQARAS